MSNVKEICLAISYANKKGKLPMRAFEKRFVDTVFRTNKSLSEFHLFALRRIVERIK